MQPTGLHYSQWETYLLTMAALTIAQQPNPQMSCILQIIQFRHSHNPSSLLSPGDSLLIVPLWLERGPLAVLSFLPPTAPSTARQIWSHWLSSSYFCTEANTPVPATPDVLGADRLARVVLVCEEKDCIPNATGLYLLAGFSEPSTWGQLLIGFQKVFIRKIYISVSYPVSRES